MTTLVRFVAFFGMMGLIAGVCLWKMGHGTYPNAAERHDGIVALIAGLVLLAGAGVIYVAQRRTA